MVVYELNPELVLELGVSLLQEDDEPTWKGLWIDGDFWNGFVNMWFTTETMKQIGEYFEVVREREGLDLEQLQAVVQDEEGEWFVVDEDVASLRGRVEKATYNGETYYGLGRNSWCWMYEEGW